MRTEPKAGEQTLTGFAPFILATLRDWRIKNIVVMNMKRVPVNERAIPIASVLFILEFYIND